ncbi:TPA: hypothetical protein DCZ15_00440 [Candidatus Falkowbacteria bacterium]|nr:hypothetical protein [Candidatus Falkowbacteria bacterium]
MKKQVKPRLDQQKLNLITRILGEGPVSPVYKGKLKKIELIDGKMIISFKSYSEYIEGKWVKKPCPSDMAIDLKSVIPVWRDANHGSALFVKNTFHHPTTIKNWKFYI